MINYLQGDEDISVGRWNDLFEDLDAKLDAALSGKSLMFWKPQRTALMGRRFYFLNDINTGRGFFGVAEPFGSWSYNLCKDDPDFITYDHAPFVAAAADLPIFNTSGSDEDGTNGAAIPTVWADDRRKLLRIKSANSARYQSIGRGANSSWGVNDNFFNYSLQAHTRLFVPEGQGAAAIAHINLATTGVREIVLTADGQNYHEPPTLVINGDGSGATASCTVTADGRVSTVTVTSPGQGYSFASVAFVTGFESAAPEPYALFCHGPQGKDRLDTTSPYSSCELVFDGYTTFTFPKEYDRYNFFRIHNLGSAPLDLEFEGAAGVVFSITIPRHASRCIRRTGVNGDYVIGFKHFHRFVSGDPRFYHQPELRDGNAEDGLFPNNLTCPSLVYRLVAELAENAAQDSERFAPAAYVDPSQFWDAASVYCSSSYPAAGTGSEEWRRWISAFIGGMPAGGYFDSIRADTVIGDLIYHRGLLEHVVINTVSAAVNCNITGFDKPYILGQENVFNVQVRKNGQILVEGLDYRLGRWASETAQTTGQMAVGDGSFSTGGSVQVNAISFYESGEADAGDNIEVTFDFTPTENRRPLAFKGFAAMKAEWPAQGVPVAVVAGGLELGGNDDADLVSISTNLVSASQGAPVVSIQDPVVIPNLTTARQVRPVETTASEYDVSALSYTVGINGVVTLGSPIPLSLEEQWLQAMAGEAARSLVLHEATVEDVKALTWLGFDEHAATDQDTPEATFTRALTMTGFGPVLSWTRRTPLAGWFGQTVFYASSAEVNADGEHLLDGTFRFGDGGWPDWLAGDPGRFLSPRVEMLFGERVWKVFSNYIPEQAKMFYASVQPLGEPNFDPDYDFTAFKWASEGDTVKRVMPWVKVKRGIGFLQPMPPSLNILTGISVWYNRSSLAYWRPGWGTTTFDLSQGNAHAWYVAERDRLLNNTPGAIDGDTVQDIYFDRMPLLVDHFNNLASLVNGLTKIRPLNFSSLFGIAPEGHANDGIYRTGIRPRHQYIRFNEFTPGAKEKLESWGVPVKTLSDFPASYSQLMGALDPRRSRVNITIGQEFVAGAGQSGGFDFWQVRGILEAFDVEVEEGPTAGRQTLFDIFGEDLFRHVQGSQQVPPTPSEWEASDGPLAEYEWIDARDLLAKCEAEGLPFIFQRVDVPLKLAFFDIDAPASDISEYTQVAVAGWPTGQVPSDLPSGASPGDWFESRVPAFVSADDAECDWIDQPTVYRRVGDHLQVWNRAFKLRAQFDPPDVFTVIKNYPHPDQPPSGAYAGTLVVFQLDADADYLRRAYLPLAFAQSEDPTFDSVMLTDYYGRPCRAVLAPMPFLDLGQDYSLSGASAAVARATYPEQRVVPGAVAAVPDEDIIVLETNPDDLETFITIAPGRAYGVMIWLNNVEEV